jgi:TrpR-related protein YerC/YecD
MTKELSKKQINELYKAILSLETEAECSSFFRDLCTISELKAMSERWQVVNQVNENVPYRKISDNTGASTATITRVAHWLHHGMGGYKLMLKKLKS